MARFISKSSNYRLVLVQGLPGSREAGTLPRNMVSVVFKDGLLDVPDTDEATIAQLNAKIAAGCTDFIAVDAIAKDPYAATRKSSEPDHEVVSLDHGSVGSRALKPSTTPTMSPEMQKIIMEAAAAMAKEMLPSMIKSTLQGIVEANKGATEEVVKTETVATTPLSSLTDSTVLGEGEGMKTVTEEIKAPTEAVTVATAPARRGRPPASQKPLEQNTSSTTTA